MYHRCVYCKRIKNCSMPIGINNWSCDSCAVWAGHWAKGNRLKNVSEEESRKWREGPCPHQTFDTSRVKDKQTGRMVQISTCRNPKCRAEIYRVFI